MSTRNVLVLISPLAVLAYASFGLRDMAILPVRVISLIP
jgi:hypothetical protein